MRATALLLAPLALGACSHCGDYEVATGFDFGGEPVDGHYFERCGVTYGTTAALGVVGDDTVWLSFWPDAHGDRGWNSVPIEIELDIPWAEIETGATITDADGGAWLTDGYNNYAVAPLVSSTVVVGEQHGDTEGDLCDVNDGDGPIYTLAWDAEWDDGGTSHYEAHGEDRVQISTWLMSECFGY